MKSYIEYIKEILNERYRDVMEADFYYKKAINIIDEIVDNTIIFNKDFSYLIDYELSRSVFDLYDFGYLWKPESINKMIEKEFTEKIKKRPELFHPSIEKIVRNLYKNIDITNPVTNKGKSINVNFVLFIAIYFSNSSSKFEGGSISKNSL